VKEKMYLTDCVKGFSPEGLAKLLEFLTKTDPKVIEDISDEKLQVRVDLMGKDTYNKLLEYFIFFKF
jgi:hypothetical protein